MSGTLNLLFQKALLVPPKSKQTGQVRDLVANKSSTFFMLLPISRTKESLVIMWSSPLWLVGSNLSNIENILPSDMKVQRIPPGSRQKQWPEAIKRCCKLLDNFDKSLKLPTLFSAVNPPENTWVSVEPHCWVLVDKGLVFWQIFAFFCRKIIRHGTACLQLEKMLLLLMIARNGRQLLELCYRGKFTVSIVASKNLTFFS